MKFDGLVEKFNGLPGKTKMGIVGAAVILGGAVVMGVMSVANSSAVQVPQATQSSQPLPSAPNTAPVVVAAQAPAVNPADATQAPVAVTPITPMGQNQAQTQNMNLNKTLPAATLDWTATVGIMERILNVSTDSGMSEFVHDNPKKLTFSADSGHANGLPSANAKLIAEYSAFIRVEKDDVYTFSGEIDCDKDCTAQVLLNDGSITNGGINKGISEPMYLVAGYHKLTLIATQPYDKAVPVQARIKAKTSNEHQMHDVQPMFITPPAAPVATQPVATQQVVQATRM